MDYFDKIIVHLNRKKPVLNEVTNNICKPIIEVKGTDLFCWHGFNYLYIHYDENKAFNPYMISIESQCTFAKRQEIGTRYYEDFAPSQEDAIECIRYRLR